MKITVPVWDSKRRAWMDRLAGSFVVLFVYSTLFLMGAASQIELTTQVKGILPTANGGTGTTSTLTGLLRGGSAYTGAELSGDATTSGSNAVTVVKINGTTIPTNSAANQVIVTSASGTAVYSTMPDCQTGAIQYNNTTHAFACGTVLTGNFSDNETPSGTVNGSTTAFTLAHTPSPAASLTCMKNGQTLIAGGADFTLATATITYVTAPITGDVHRCSYRW